jgi:hypothetical protein
MLTLKGKGGFFDTTHLTHFCKGLFKNISLFKIDQFDKEMIVYVKLILKIDKMLIQDLHIVDTCI